MDKKLQRVIENTVMFEERLPVGFFKRFIKENQYFLTANGFLKDKDGNYIQIEPLFDIYVKNTYMEQVRLCRQIAKDQEVTESASKIKNRFALLNIGKTDRGACIEEGIKYYRDKAMTAIRDKVKCHKEDLTLLTEFVGALTGHPPKETDVYALAHSMWMVKRALFNKERKYHHMLVLYGKQGVGKSQALLNLFKPLKDLLMSNTDLSMIADSSSQASYETSYIQFFEELAGAEKTAITALKNIITAEFGDTRMRYSKNKDRFQNRATFFASSNVPLETLIYDSTGMRRFYELNVSDGLRNSWGKLNKLDYTAMWAGIDESLPLGYVAGKYSKIGEAIAKVKQSYVQEDAKQAFLDSFNIKPSEELRPVSSKVFMQAYKTFLTENGMETQYSANTSIRAFSAMLKKQGFEPVKHKNTRCWMVNQDCYLPFFGNDEIKVVKGGK